MSLPLNILFWILVIPVTVALGLVASWIVRKVSAVVQYRIGPPVMQPFYDVMKLMGKETLIPRDSQQAVFIAAPLVGLAGALVLAIILLRTAFLILLRTPPTQAAFGGDIIVAIYLMVLPSLALIFGSSASASPHAAVGTGREMKLVMGYELPLVLAFVVVIIKTGGTLNLAVIGANTTVFSISNMLAFLAALFCVQAKLGFVPFDIAEAETELGSGVLMEYSGPLLAVWKVMQAALLVVLPLFLVMVFLGGFGTGLAGALAGIGKYVLVLVLIILIKNTNPRVRIDQAMKFFWVYCSLALVVAVALAIISHSLVWPRL